MSPHREYSLTPQQRKIVEAPFSQSQLVIAPPGAGKTHVVIGRIQYLIEKEKLQPSQILALCFTRTAVAEITHRLKTLVRSQQLHDDLRFVSIRTFDSFATRMLLASNHEGNLDGFNYDARIELAIEALQNRKGESAQIVSRFCHLIVDEVQDLVGVRARFVQKLIERIPGGFTLLGDPAQAIYGFSNNELETQEIMKWVKAQRWIEGVIERTLQENHRSSGDMADTTNAIRKTFFLNKIESADALDQLRTFVGKLKKAGTGKSPKLPTVEPDETLGVLCRSNGELLQLASLFNASGVKFTIKPRPEDTGLPAWIGRALATYEASRISKSEFENRWKMLIADKGPDVQQAWESLKRVEARDEGNLDLRALNSHLRHGSRLPDDVDAFLNSGQGNISISTVHSVKGREFDKVVILRPEETDDTQPARGDFMEEARILYVAATRARKELAKLGRAGLPKMWKMEYGDNRHRWIASLPYNGFNFVEVGVPGDVDPLSAISKYIYPQSSRVEDTQNFIWNNIQSGTTVKLVRLNKGHYTFYQIVSDETCDQPAITLGQMSLSFRNDMTRVLQTLSKGKRFFYPSYMQGIQVAAVVTNVVKPYEENIHEPYAISGFCLGLRLRGMGFIYKRS
jgi:DNA helicase II / ATP-dependent DNA helicase PcrA